MTAKADLQLMEVERVNGKEEGTENTTDKSGERSVLRWGGLAGIVGSFLFVLANVIQAVFIHVEFVGAPDADFRGLFASFPGLSGVLTIKYDDLLASYIVFIILFLTLYRALRSERSLAPSLFGGVLGVLGLLMLAAGALPGVAFGHLSGLDLGSNTTVLSRKRL
jgi:hypothetical protein